MKTKTAMIHEILLQNQPTLENESTLENLRVGARGWDQAHWRDNFYPHDLPEDWRLGYYSNEFNCVLLPTSAWQSAWQTDRRMADIEQLQAWSEDVPEDFRFYFELDAGAANATVSESVMQAHQALQQGLGIHFAGLVGGLRDNTGQPENMAPGIAKIIMAEKNLRQWREWLQCNAAGLCAVILCDEQLSYQQLDDFKSLVELLNL